MQPDVLIAMAPTPIFSDGFQSRQPPLGSSNLGGRERRVQSAACCVWRWLAAALLVAGAAASITVALTTSMAAVAVVATIIAAAALLSAPLVVVSATARRLILDYFVASVVEVGAFLAAAVTFPILGTWFDPHPQQTNKRPILMVHGYCHDSAAWHYLRRRLNKAGEFGPIYTVNLGSPLRSIEHYSTVVRTKIGQIAQDTGCKEITLIGHSMGGLVSSFCAAGEPLEGNVKIRQVITLGSPLHGTKMAMLGFGECARQMRHHSPFVMQLEDKIKAAKDVRFCHMGSNTDIVVRPLISATRGVNEQVEADNVKYRTFRRLGHLSYLWSPRIARAIIEELRALH